MTELQRIYLSFLEEEDEGVREEAARGLSEQLTGDVVDALIEMLGENHCPGVLEIIWLLGRSEEPQAGEVLIQHLTHANPRVREMAASALAEIADIRALNPLLEALEDKEMEVREAAATALGELRDSRAVPRLITLLESPDSQYIAAAALGVIGDKRGIKPLIQLMENSEDEALRATLARALGYFDNPKLARFFLERLWLEKSEYVLAEIIKVLGDWDVKEAIPALEEVLNTTQNARIRLSTAVTLGRLGDEICIPHLTQALADDPDWSRRLNALIGLKSFKTEEVFQAMTQALGDEHWLIQKQAALSLLENQSPAVYEVLQQFLSDEDEDIMRALIESSIHNLEDETEED